MKQKHLSINELNLIMDGIEATGYSGNTKVKQKENPSLKQTDSCGIGLSGQTNDLW